MPPCSYCLQWVDMGPGPSARQLRTIKRKKVQESAHKYLKHGMEKYPDAAVVIGAYYTNDRGMQYIQPGHENILSALVAVMDQVPQPSATQVNPTQQMPHPQYGMVQPAPWGRPATAVAAVAASGYQPAGSPLVMSQSAATTGSGYGIVPSQQGLLPPVLPPLTVVSQPQAAGAHPMGSLLEQQSSISQPGAAATGGSQGLLLQTMSLIDTHQYSQAMPAVDGPPGLPLTAVGVQGHAGGLAARTVSAPVLGMPAPSATTPYPGFSPGPNTGISPTPSAGLSPGPSTGFSPGPSAYAPKAAPIQLGAQQSTWLQPSSTNPAPQSIPMPLNGSMQQYRPPDSSASSSGICLPNQLTSTVHLSSVVTGDQQLADSAANASLPPVSVALTSQAHTSAPDLPSVPTSQPPSQGLTAGMGHIQQDTCMGASAGALPCTGTHDPGSSTAATAGMPAMCTGLVLPSGVSVSSVGMPAAQTDSLHTLSSPVPGSVRSKIEAFGGSAAGKPTPVDVAAADGSPKLASKHRAAIGGVGHDHHSMSGVLKYLDTEEPQAVISALQKTVYRLSEEITALRLRESSHDGYVDRLKTAQANAKVRMMQAEQHRDALTSEVSDLKHQLQQAEQAHTTGRLKHTQLEDENHQLKQELQQLKLQVRSTQNTQDSSHCHDAADHGEGSICAAAGVAANQPQTFKSVVEASIQLLQQLADESTGGSVDGW